jgi:hypothetical protein
MKPIYTFYQAIEFVLTKGKRMRRIGWNGCYKAIFYTANDMICTTYIIMETDTEYKIYLPSADDIIANDWIEV